MKAALSPGMKVTKAVGLVRPLGEGGMGAVWLGEHAGLKTQIVVKFMVDGLDGSSAARQRFSREAEAAAQVKSPHVVQMLDHGLTDDGVPFIVMEHLEGRDLSAVLAERGKLEPREVVVIVMQLAKALQRVHGAGLIHRDIKPSNIFLVDQGDDEIFVKLLDFGIAKPQSSEEKPITLDGDTKTGQLVGTPFYMSPEQVTAQRSIDHRADLWALGVVSWELLVGTRPFAGPSFGALAVAIATGALPPSPPHLPPSFEAWFAKACARDLGERFSSARLLADGLRGVFEGESFSLPPATPLLDSASGNHSVASLAETQPSPHELRGRDLAKTEVAVVSRRSEDGNHRAASLGWMAMVVVAVVGFAIWKFRPAEPPPMPAVAPPPSSVAIVPSVPSVPSVPNSAAPVVSTAPPSEDAAVPVIAPKPAPPRPVPSLVPSAPTPRPKPSNDDPLF